MKARTWHAVALVALAIVFAVALTYATVELPHVLSSSLLQLMGDAAGPDFDYETGLSQHFVDSYHIRVIGACCLTVVAALIVVGLLVEHSGLSSFGAIALFLPVFGHFALTMSMLAGLGMLRVIWMPIVELAPGLLRLGDIAFLPYMTAVYVPALAGVDMRTPLIYGLMGFGLVLFVLGAFVWFQVRATGQSLASTWTYRLSRHPQYLGWIIWSYGLMIYVSRLPGPRISWSVESSLPWLIATVAIVCVALLEEVKLRRELGSDYSEYEKSTPFLVPLPHFMSRLVSLPLRIVLGKDKPECGREVVLVFALYSGMLIALSIPFAIFDWPAREQAMWIRFPYDVPPFR